MDLTPKKRENTYLKVQNFEQKCEPFAVNLLESQSGKIT